MFLCNKSFGNVNIFLTWMKCQHLRNVCKVQIQGAVSCGGQAGLILSQQKHAFKTVEMFLSPRFPFFFSKKMKQIQFLLPRLPCYFYKVKHFHQKGLEEGRWIWLSIHILAEQVQILLCFDIHLISTIPVCSGGLRWDMKGGNAAVCWSPIYSPCPIKSQIFPLISGRKGRVGNMAPSRFNFP